MTQVPAFIEFEPDNYKPIEECSKDELEDCIFRLAFHGRATAEEAVRDAESNGVSPINAEMMEVAAQNFATVDVLESYIQETFPRA